VTFDDPIGNDAAASVDRGLTGEMNGGNPILDTGGIALRGHFSIFRYSFAPTGSLGSNADSSNGIISRDGANLPRISSVVGSRAFGYNGVPAGACATPVDSNPANLVGAYAEVYRIFYMADPNPALASRLVTASVTSLGVRYLFAVNGTNGSASAALNLAMPTFTFQVGPPCATLQITSNPMAVSRCQGATAGFSIAATGTGSLTYRWRRNGTDLADQRGMTGTGSNAMSIAGLIPGDAGSYDCVVSNGCTSVTSSAATLTVQDCCPSDLDDGTGTGVPDGGVGIEDLLYYLARYDTGC
jgi:hypothetical protein